MLLSSAATVLPSALALHARCSPTSPAATFSTTKLLPFIRLLSRSAIWHTSTLET